MTRLKEAGFEANDTSELWFNSGCSVSSAQSRTGKYSMYAPSAGGANFGIVNGLNNATLYMRAAVRFESIPASVNYPTIFELETSTSGNIAQVLVGQNANGTFDLFVTASTDGVNYGTVATVSNVSLSRTAWSVIEAQFTVGVSGTYAVKIDGTTVASGTTNMGTTNIAQISHGNFGSVAGSGVWFDDIGVDDTAFIGTGFPITHAGTSATAEVASGNLTLTEPAGVQEGDMLIAMISFRATTTFTLPAGWTIISTQANTGNTTVNSTASVVSHVAAYISRGATTPSLTFTRTGGDLAVGAIMAIRGKGALSYDTGSANVLAAASTAVTGNSITTTRPESFIFMGSSLALSTSVSGRAMATDPLAAAWTETLDYGTTTAADGGVAMGYAKKASAGSTGAPSYTAASSARHGTIMAAFYTPTITHVGSAQSSTTTVALPAHQTGDLIVIVASRYGTTSAASLPAGYTQIFSDTGGSGGTGCSQLVGYKFATSSGETSGTWTNANALVASVYRNVAKFAVSAAPNWGSTSSSLFYAAQTMQNTTSSWLFAAATIASASSTIETPPTGLVLRQDVVTGSGETVVLDSNQPIPTWSQPTVALGVTASWCSFVMELTASPNSITALSGAYVETINDIFFQRDPGIGISYVGSASGTTTADLSGLGIQIKDIIVVAAYNFTGTAIATPVGWTQISGGTWNSSGAYRQIFYKFAGSSAETLGTVANSQHLIVQVYRGVSRLGSTAATTTSSVNLTWPSIPNRFNTVKSWVLNFAAVVSTTTSMETGRSDSTLRQNVVGAVGEIAGFDTNGPFAGVFGSQTVSLGVSTPYASNAIELIPYPLELTGGPGAYTVSAPNPPLIRPSPISFIGSATGVDTATIPAHVAGDLIVVAAYNVTNTNVITAPSGFTTIAASANGGRYYRYAYKLATSSSETISTMTNATICAVNVYRGTRQITPVGTAQTSSSTGSTILTYPGLTIQADGSSWVFGAALVTATTSTIEVPPTNMTLRANLVDATSEIATVDTNGGVGLWTSRNVNYGAFANANAATFEIFAPQNPIMTANPGSYAWTGADVGIYKNYTLSAGPGSYSLTGQDTPILRALLMSGDPGAYVWTGSSVNFALGAVIYATAGSYALSGSDISVNRSLVMSGAAGAYAYTGADTGIYRNLLLAGDPGAYTWDGPPLTFDISNIISAGAGSYAISGADTGFVRALLSSCAPGAYALSGADTPMVRALFMDGTAGAYSLTGADTSIFRSLLMSGDPGSYAWTGANTTFVRDLLINGIAGSYAVSGADTTMLRALLVRGDVGSYTIDGDDVGFELTVVSIRMKRYVDGVWETNRLKMYKDGEWIKPPLKRYVSGVWVLVND